MTIDVKRSKVKPKFHALADQRWANILKTGKTVPLEQAAAYLKARALGHRVKKPVARKIALPKD
jgi:hypothetical protein